MADDKNLSNAHPSDILNPFAKNNPLLGEGAILGPADNSAQEAQAEFLKRMMGREGDLYPELKQKLADAGVLNQEALDAIVKGTGPIYEKTMSSLQNASNLYPEAFSAATAETNKLYPGVLSDIQTAGKNAQSLTLPPEALKALNDIRTTRLKDIDAATNTMIGDRVSDLAKRGVISSSTAEGSMGEVGKAIAPAINQAEADYAAAKLSLPQQLYGLAKDAGITTFGLGSTKDAQSAGAYDALIKNLTGNAKDIYNTGVGQAGLTSTAYDKASSNLLNPYLQMWGNTAGIGAQNPAAKDKNTAGAGAIGNIIGSIAAA